MLSKATLEKAIELIEAKGWAQGVDTAPSGAVCVSRAAHMASGVTETMLSEEDCPVCPALVETLGEGSVDDLTSWNDTKGRTKEEVIARLRRAAEVAS